MDSSAGLLTKLWSFISFLPFFFLLFILGITKGPIAFAIMLVGNSSVIIGLWTAHVVWTYYCVARTKRFGLAFKVVVLICLPLPLLLCPVLGIVGSILGGIGYGFFAPLFATFEAVGENFKDKIYHCCIDGSWSTIKTSCTVVEDVTDFCFHSYFSYMDELRENLPPQEKPFDIRLSLLPCCLLVTLVGVPLDVVLITSIAIWKSPYMLFRGWKRLLEDLIGRKGPFLETECVPFAGLAIILWPLAVIGAVLAATIFSIFLGLYSGVVVHQEDSTQMGFAYIVSVVSLFDEYVNDLLFLREGSCLPRPAYRKNMRHALEKRNHEGSDHNLKNWRDSSQNLEHTLQQTRSMKWKIHHYKPVQIWDWLFKSCEVNGRIVLRDGLISVKEIEECISKGNCKILSTKLPAWSLLQCLLTSAKSNSDGLIISDDVELTKMNGPKDKVFEWFIGPLLVMKDQVKNLELQESEETCLKELVMRCKNDIPEDWDGTGFPSDDNVRRAQLQAIIRRLLGIVASMSRMPTFRRRFRNLVKVLYIEGLQASASAKESNNIDEP
ncbi:uncharacterized membrane protein At3g27390 isoform X3 [Lathyrus oleraceus]|uniref:uncharacterized membrane protein At3g27390 isoform X3 n=1 Tax=Pisum sativum TaxID=3888 RepID=UPI0021D189A6|nr:uncharacterized membrane protein At3g27390 isoform X3 [Pisum sativum]